MLDLERDDGQTNPRALRGRSAGARGGAVRPEDSRHRTHYRGTEIVRLELETIEGADEVSAVPLDSLFGRGRTWFGDAPSGELTRSLWARDE